MTIQVVQNGELVALNLLVNNGENAEDLVLRLYQNSHVPVDDDTLAAYTEADFPGYAAVTLTGNLWTAQAGNPSSVAYEAVQFVCSADTALQTIYGYYLTRFVTGDLILAEEFAAPIPIQSVGNRVIIAPRIEASDTTD